MLAKNQLFQILIVCFIAGCGKDSKTYAALADSKWQLSAVWQGSGSSDDGWHSAAAGSQTLSFDKYGKGTVYYYGIPSQGYFYQVTGDSSIDSRGDSVIQTGHERFYIAGDTLTIYGTSCIEGCLSRYLRILSID